MSKWKFKGRVVNEPPAGAFGFVYLIQCKKHPIYGGWWYIGAKQLNSTRTKKLSKKAQLENWSGKGRKPTKIKVTTSSGWETYNSSSKELQSVINEVGEENFDFKILEWAKSKVWLQYLETFYIFKNKALLTAECWNKWVSCRIRRENLG